MENKKHIMQFIYRYTIYRDGKPIENNIIGWKTALAHARIWSLDLFDQPRRIEILNIWTGEIISLAEAERRANALMRQSLVVPHQDTVRT